MLNALSAMDFARRVLAEESDRRAELRESADKQLVEYAREPEVALEMLKAAMAQCDRFVKYGKLL